MADNKTAQYSKTLSTTEKGATECHVISHTLSDINASFSSIPKYSKITTANLTYKVKRTTAIASSSKGTYGVDFYSGTEIYWYDHIPSGLKDIVSSTQVKNNTEASGTVSILSYANGNNAPNIISYSGANSIRIWHNYAYMWKSYTNGTLTINLVYNEPRAIVSVSKSGEGTVTGAGTYHYNNSYTITATPAAGWKFVRWADDPNAPASRTFTVNSSLITAYETQKSYQAIFEKLTYTVTFKDDNGATLQTATVNHGDTVTPPTSPTKADTAQHKYTFDGWYDQNGNKWTSNTTITSDMTFTARYTATVQKYTVRWFNYDGTLLETDTDVPYGNKPTYNGATPTRPSDDYYTYGFAGWSPSTDEVIQGDKDFTAQFAQVDRYYTVRWVNASAVQGVEGALLETDTVKFNTQPDYNGATPKHPKQDTDPALNYDFIGWSAKVTDPAKPDTELETVKGDITYTAIYETTPKLYAITVILFDGQSTDVYEYGTEVTIEAPKIVDFHQFVKWTDGDTRLSRTVTVTGEATYQAVYERIPIPYKVNLEQVTGCYIVPTTQTIVYIINGTVPTVEIGAKGDMQTVDGWSFLVSNTIPENGYPLEKLFINGIRVY